MAGTLVLSNGTVVPGNFLPFHGTLPSNVVFDGALGDLYVTNLGNGVSTGNVSVVNASTAEVVGSIPVSGLPYGEALDPATGRLFVADQVSGNVLVFDTRTQLVVGEIAAGTYPFGVAFDGANGDVYVANTGSDNVTVINGSDNEVVGSVGVGQGPDGVAVDPSNGLVYIANALSNNVSVLNGTTNAVVDTVAVGGGRPGWPSTVRMGGCTWRTRRRTTSP